LKRKLILTAAFVLVFFVGVGIGASGKTKTVTTAAKTVTVTTTGAANSVTARLLRQRASQQVLRQRALQRRLRKRASQRLAAAKRATTKSSGGKEEAVFSVTGTAPSGVDITYGNDSSNYQGSALPFHAKLHVKNDAMYYTVTAQLQGSGRIMCKLTIGNAVKVGHAAGGYNICSAQLNSDFSGGFG
jgi:hypothetical protein